MKLMVASTPDVESRGSWALHLRVAVVAPRKAGALLWRSCLSADGVNYLGRGPPSIYAVFKPSLRMFLLASEPHRMCSLPVLQTPPLRVSSKWDSLPPVHTVTSFETGFVIGLDAHRHA